MTLDLIAQIKIVHYAKMRRVIFICRSPNQKYQFLRNPEVMVDR